MSTASASFTAAGLDSDVPILVASTTYILPGDESENLVRDVSLVRLPPARLRLEREMTTALEASGDYPVDAGVDMLDALAWRPGVNGLLAAGAKALKVTLSPESCAGLPEMVPVDVAGRTMPLDHVMPVYRAHHVDRLPVARRGDLSLAIIFQESWPFADLARDLRHALASRLRVDDYPGSEFADVSVREAMLREVFHEHRAILFLGHLGRDAKGRGSWQLAADVEVSMTDLHRLLGGGRAPVPVRAGAALRRSACIPEVVFSSSCCSAWADPPRAGRPQVFYPDLFLDAGVRFFVGTWMDVIVAKARAEGTLDVLRTLVTEFFLRWADETDGAVAHLYEAKKATGFDLVTSLYQIYRGAPEGKAEEDEAVAAPASGIATGDRLGDYVLGPELWADPYARTFWADHPNGTPVLVQVLVDEWQASPALADALERAVDQLREAKLGPGHLVPTSHEHPLWSRDGEPVRRLHVLLYAVPAPAGSSQDLVTLASVTPDLTRPDHMQEVLAVGGQVALRLADLHGHHLRHGNLDRRAVVLVRNPGESALSAVLLKDGWARQVRPGRCTSPRYGAPDEPVVEELADRLKLDCWGLGVVLFEMATGEPPFGDAERPDGARVSVRALSKARGLEIPDALEGVVTDCLMPVAALRPTSELISRRLVLALVTGGADVGDLEREIDTHVRAGSRLFAVISSDTAAVDAALTSLAARPLTTGLTYRLFEAAENLGLQERTGRRTLAVNPWVTAADMQAWAAEEARERGEAPPPPPLPDDVGAANGDLALWAMNELPPPGRGEMPVLWFRGAEWWSSGPAWTQLRTNRLLRDFQERGYPAVVVSDSFMHTEPSLLRRFVVLGVPPLPPSTLLERVLAAPETDRLVGSPVDPDVAIDVASGLHPCGRRELVAALRLAAVQHGAIDERVIGIRDEERVAHLPRTGGVSIVPVLKLPDPDSVGLPPALAGVVASWTDAVRTLRGSPSAASVPRRLAVTGPSGYGKTALARSLAARTGLPLVRIDSSRCLQGGLGASERALRLALISVGTAGALVLLDDADRLFDTAGAAGTTLAATLGRMSSVLLAWLDAMPDDTVAVLTATAPELFPAPWRRRVQLWLPLDRPDDLEQRTSASIDYRRAVLAAIFRARGLPEVAGQEVLLDELARATHPSFGGPVRSPVARRAAGTALEGDEVELRTGADLEWWVAETLLLHVSAAEPDAPTGAAFWRAAIGSHTEGREAC